MSNRKQFVVPVSLHENIMKREDLPHKAGHLDESRMFGAMRLFNYCPAMAVHVAEFREGVPPLRSYSVNRKERRKIFVSRPTFWAQ